MLHIILNVYLFVGFVIAICLIAGLKFHPDLSKHRIEKHLSTMSVNQLAIKMTVLCCLFWPFVFMGKD